MSMQTDIERKILKALEKEYMKELRQLGKETVIVAQKLVPVVTGQLKKSFSVKNVPLGVEIRYDTDYAWDVHEGKNTHKLKTPWVASTRKHKRKLQSGKIVTVRKHNKVYKEGYKPVSMAGGWAAINVNTIERSPKRWLQDAWHIIYNKQDKETKKLLPKELRIINTEQGGAYNG